MCPTSADGKQLDPTAGALLHQIRYWRAKARPWIGGRRWIAKSAEEWAAETCLSVSQYRRALKKLKTAKVIVAEQHLFAGRNLAHIRPLTFIALDASAPGFRLTWEAAGATLESS
jgi:hypothetical protein